jgi:hypothetical protein
VKKRPVRGITGTVNHQIKAAEFSWPNKNEKVMEQFDCAVDHQGRRQVMNRQISMLHELQGIGLNVFSHLSGATKLWAMRALR